MYLRFQNVISIIICLTISFVNTQPNEDRTKVRKYFNYKIISNKNKTCCLPMNLKEIISNIKQQQAEQQSYKNIPAIDFLLKERDSAIREIFNIDSKKALDVLKADTYFVKNITRYEDKTENYSGQSKNHSSSIVTTTSVSPTNDPDDVEEENISLKNIFPTDTALNIFNFMSTNYAIDILKSATNNIENSKNTTIDNKKVNKEIEVKNNDTNKNSNINFDRSPEIILSELSSFSNNEEDGSRIGQKIVYQNSNGSADSADANSPGAEILKNESKICGYFHGKRISFANETTLMEFPWTALLLYNTKLRYHCGGSLITGKYVLTAAHCVAQQFYELIGVRLGEYDISEPIDCAPDVGGDVICAHTVDVDVVKIIVHHEYSHLSFKNDIALLRLDKNYISRSYYPICIPTPEMTYSNTQATVAGWGATEKAIRSSIMLKADVPIHDMSKCREIYRNNVFSDTTEICGSGANEVDVCKGDSGGALFHSKTDNGKDKYYQMGIISLGVRQCGDSRFLPAIFTKLTGFYKWIENNLEY